MKKILLLLLVGVINLNAYEYLIENRKNVSGYNYDIFYVNNYNDLKGCVKIFDYKNGSVRYTQTLNIILNLGEIKIRDGGQGTYYISNETFQNYYKNDLNFLNDLYTTNNVFLTAFLNYLYNDKFFNENNYIQYTDYELLYNSDGFAVESLVNGVYAGLYNMDEMQFSGNLYNKNGDLVLVNGVEPSYLQMLCDKLIGDLHLKMLDAENLIDKGWIFAVALTFAMLYLVARTLKRVLLGKNNKGVENES